MNLLSILLIFGKIFIFLTRFVISIFIVLALYVFSRQVKHDILE